MKKYLCKGFVLLWISLITLFFTQGMLIKANAVSSDVEIIKTNVIQNKNKCLEVDVKIPILESKNVKYINDEIDLWTNGWINDVKVVIEEYQKMGYICNYPFQLYAKYSVTENNSDILSLYIDYYQFTGGAHGITNRRLYTIDRKTGNKLNLEKLFKEGYEYQDVIDKEIRKQINDDKDKYFEEGKLFKGVNRDTSYYINKENLVIHFESYEIAPYSSGMPEFNIPLNLFKDNFLYDNMEI